MSRHILIVSIGDGIFLADLHCSDDTHWWSALVYGYLLLISIGLKIHIGGLYWSGYFLLIHIILEIHIGGLYWSLDISS